MSGHRLALTILFAIVVAMSLPVAAATLPLGPSSGIDAARAQQAPNATSTPAAPAPTGELVVVPGVGQVGQTTLAVGLHVAPFDTEVAIHYSEHFTPQGETCDSATPGATQPAAAPTWVTLNACSVGNGYVRLVVSATGYVIEEASVTVTPPGVIGQGTLSVALSGVTSRELTPGVSEDEFEVSAAGLSSGKTYELNTVALNGISAAFDRNCSDFKQTERIRLSTSATRKYKAYGCAAPGTYIWSYVEEVNGPAIASSGLTDHFLNVADPTVSFGSSAYSVNEGADRSITVSLSHGTGHRLRIPITVTNGTAESGDYSVSGLTRGELTFEPHDTSESFTIRTNGDSDCDDETVNLSFGALPSHVSADSTSRATPTIRDDEICVSFVSSSYPVNEGSRVDVAVELSKAPGRTLRIPVRVSPGSVRTVNFGRSDTSRTFPYFASQDRDCDNESVGLSFGILPQGVLKGSRDEAEIAVGDDDVCVSFDSSSYSVNEGSSRSVRVELSKAPGRTLRIPVRVSPGVDRTVTFSSSATSQTFTYTPPTDTDCEDETVELSFGALPLGVVRGSPDEVDITVRDDAVCVSFGASTYWVSEGGSTRITVRLSPASGRSLTIPITVRNGSAESDDYSVSGLINGALTFSRGDTSETFTIATVDDTAHEGNETVNLGFGTLPVGVSAGSPSAATLTIGDDDPPPCAPTFGGASVGDKSWRQGAPIAPFILPRATGQDCNLTHTLSPALPTGVNLDSSTRRVSGTPTAALGRTRYTWRARDSRGAAVALTFHVTVAPAAPTITIAPQAASVTEGHEVRFILLADRVPATELTVNVSVTDTGSFLDGAPPTLVRIATSSNAAQLTLRTDNDAVDEANGTTTVAILSGVGYTIGSPPYASVAVHDNDVPLTPTGLRANGHLDSSGNVTLRWNPLAGATGYNVRYVEEVCTPGVRCEPDGGSANPNWQTHANITTSGGATKEAVLGGLATSTLYRVEVQAVVVDASSWSGFDFVYPTRDPLTSITSVALMEMRDFQADGQNAGSYRYTICLDNSVTVSNPMYPAVSGAWTVTDIIAAIKDAIESWETAVGDSSILSTTADPETSPANCEDPMNPSTQNQVLFVGNREMDSVCGVSLLGCWRNLGGDLSTGVPFDKQSVILRASGGGVAWDTVTNGCSRLRTAVAHEVGHALGIRHPDIGLLPPRAVREMYLMYGAVQGVCEPQAYDVAAAMANYQSR